MLRKLMGWISGGREDEPQVPVPPRESRRHQRIQLPGARVFLGGAGPYPVLNLSFGGLRAAMASADLPEPVRHALRIDDQVDAVVELPPSRFATKLAVKNVAPEAVGFAFQGLNYEAAQILAGYLRPAILGGSLAEIVGAGVKSPDPGLRLRWFQGQDGTKVYLWQAVDDGATVKEEFYFAEYVMIWKQDRGEIQTMRVRTSGGEPGQKGFRRSDDQMAVFYDAPPYRALRLGQAILAAAELPAEVKDPLLDGIARAEDRLYRRYLVRERDAQLGVRLASRPEVLLPIVDLSERGLALMTDDAGASALDRDGFQGAEIQLPGSGLQRSPREAGGEAGKRAPAEPARSGRPTLRLACRLRRVYQQRPVSGCAFELVRPEDAESLAAFLAPRMLAQHLELDEHLPEEMQQVPGGGRSYLYVGLLSSHLYTRLRTGGQFFDGRLVVGEHVLAADHRGLHYYRNSGPLLLAVNPELPMGQLETLAECPAEMRGLARELLQAAEVIAEEVRQAWLALL